MKKIIICVIAFALVACASSSKMNKVSLGMTKQEVISVLGEPDSTSAQDNTEYLTYKLWRDFWDRRPGDYSDPYFVRLINGKVESYGRTGDFDSTKVPEKKETIDLNINPGK